MTYVVDTKYLPALVEAYVEAYGEDLRLSEQLRKLRCRMLLLQRAINALSELEDGVPGGER